MKVVFHADDFGLTEAVNAGIVDAFERGVLRSTSLMVAADAAEGAVAAARAHPGLDVGLHLTLVEERPVLPPARVPSLVTGDRFWPRHPAVALRWALGRWRVAEAAGELEAQWERMRTFGLTPSHCDGHQHLHLLPGLLPAVMAQARRYGVRFVRTRLVGGGGRAARRVQLLAIQAVSRLAWLGVPADARTAVPFVTVGFLEAGGALTVPHMLETLDHLAGNPAHGIVEVMLHPGRPDADTARKYAHWNYRWERDLEVLLDPRLPEALAGRGIEVTSFRDLARDATSAN